MPVTQEVAGSSPVRTVFIVDKKTKRCFVFFYIKSIVYNIVVVVSASKLGLFFFSKFYAMNNYYCFYEKKG